MKIVVTCESSSECSLFLILSFNLKRKDKWIKNYVAKYFKIPFHWLQKLRSFQKKRIIALSADPHWIATNISLRMSTLCLPFIQYQIFQCFNSNSTKSSYLLKCKSSSSFWIPGVWFSKHVIKSLIWYIALLYVVL